MPDMPPGERAEDELSPAEAIVAVGRAWDRANARTGPFVELPEAKPRRLTLGDVAVTREGRWIVLRAQFRRAPRAGVTLRISRAWAQVVHGRLGKVLGA